MRSGAPWANCAASTAAGLSAPTQAATTTPAAAIIRFALTVAGTSLVGHIGWTHPPQRATALDHAAPRGAACGPLPAQCWSIVKPSPPRMETLTRPSPRPPQCLDHDFACYGPLGTRPQPAVAGCRIPTARRG